jgi:hypothetical protein
VDVISHGLWATALGETLRRRGLASKWQVAGAAAFGLMPDLVALIPVSVWAIGSESATEAIRAYIFAQPGTEPVMAPWAQLLEHNIHCSAHSVVVLALITLLSFWKFRRLLIPLAGWWLHVVLDIPTHSREYYAVTIFYPISTWSFDGIAWTDPGVLVTNYMALAVTYAWLFATRPRGIRKPA